MFLQPSNKRLALFVLLYVVHGAITVRALADFSLIGIVQQAFLNWGTGQIFSDLGFALVLACGWLAADARRRGVMAWPWLVATVAFGSLSPGLYLILREVQLRREAGGRGVVGG